MNCRSRSRFAVQLSKGNYL